ncbi:hypothetical protein A9Q84_12595 [Halobacteriovorax marinus]|uniref:Uncharacterized protein n=1 Tax=Halobacteriovorax marinus TaxID=97084 RepID=A0A1Y5FDW4_9BACT|nr:hypothetical protein A9Q84_12595 [Halobacteriovorax marinus]
MKKFALAFLALSTCFASEIDPFNGRDVELANALPVINAKANFLMQDALDKANEKDECSEKALYKQLRKKFRNQYTSEFSKWVVETEQIEKVTTNTSDSIYQDFKWFQAIVPGLFAKISDPAGKVMRVNGVLIGTDKFEHFFGSGFNYFKKFYLKEKTLEKAMNIGYRAETGFLGAMMTGVMSYADMVANFNGMRFWNTMLGKHVDILTLQPVSPYVSCKEGKWQQVRELELGAYIDDAWDEGINCSWFRTEKLVDKVKVQMAKYARRDNISITCPMSTEKLNIAGEKYQNLPIDIVNYQGHQPLKKLKK